MSDNARYGEGLVNSLLDIALRANDEYSLGPEEAKRFAWFSVNRPGDASIDDKDFYSHLGEWAHERAQETYGERVALNNQWLAACDGKGAQSPAERERRWVLNSLVDVAAALCGED